MRDITILHLYNDTLDLYGDYFNVTAIRNRIAEMGGSCTLLTANLEDEDIPLEQADLVYMGHGKARNLAAVAPHFARFGQRVKDAVEGGKVFFVTGNSRLLFGREFEGVTEGLTHQGIGLFDYTGTETNKVFTSDVFGRCCFDQAVRTYGFINRTQHIVGENTAPIAARAQYSQYIVPTAATARVKISLPTVEKWYPEKPVLYTAEFRLVDADGNVLDVESMRVGFKRVDIEDGILLINGQRALIFGVNRHDFAWKTGRAVSREHMAEGKLRMISLQLPGELERVVEPVLATE